MDNTTERQSPYETDNTMWEINSDGYAYFHNIEADNGLIAGWHINNDMIYNTKGTYLSASGKAQGNDNTTYTISTNSLYASGGNVGGWAITSAGLSSSNISLLNSGVLQLGRVTLRNERDGLLINGPILASGIISGADHTTPDGRSFNMLYKDFKVTKYGSSDYTRIGYLDHLFETWGTITPNQVWVGGYNATTVNIEPNNDNKVYSIDYDTLGITVYLQVKVDKILPSSNLNDRQTTTTTYHNVEFLLDGPGQIFYNYGYSVGWRAGYDFCNGNSYGSDD